MGIVFKTTDNTKRVIDKKDEVAEATLEVIGAFLADQSAKMLNTDAYGPRRVDTGRLMNSVSWATNGSAGSPNGADGSDGAKRGSPKKGELQWGTNVEYAEYVHEGTSKMEANRFLQNGFQINKDQVEKLVKTGLKNVEEK